jgi:putative phosphoesterase
LRIGIVSDSHKKIGLLESALNILKDNGAEFIIHAGDIVLKESLDLLRSAGLPYQAVFGNNDIHLLGLAGNYNINSEPHYFNIGNISAKLMHYPYYLNNDTDLIVFGHTHYFECESKNNTLYINPGEICARKKPVSEFALIEKENDSWRVFHYEKDMLKEDSKYKTEEIIL